jgi:hypothetical protein
VASRALLRREAGGTALTLQNLDVEQLLALRPHVPPAVVKVQLAPRFRDRLADKAQLGEAFAAFQLSVVP